MEKIKVHKEKIERKKAFIVEGKQEEMMIMDKEGADMTNQFLTLKKKKNQLDKNSHFDDAFDLREFFTKKKHAKYFADLKSKKPEQRGGGKPQNGSSSSSER